MARSILAVVEVKVEVVWGCLCAHRMVASKRLGERCPPAQTWSSASPSPSPPHGERATRPDQPAQEFTRASEQVPSLERVDSESKLTSIAQPPCRAYTNYLASNRKKRI